MNSAGCSQAKWLVVVRRTERDVVLPTGDGTPEAPVIDEESAHRPWTLHVTRTSVADGRVHVGARSLASQLSCDVVGVIPGVIRDGNDVTHARRDTPRRSHPGRGDRSIHDATSPVGRDWLREV